MYERDHPRDPERGTADERDERADTDRLRREWTFSSISSGDSHDKGEQSLCVGEAA